MHAKPVYLVSALAALAVAIAMTAGRSPIEAPRSDAALKARIAELRAEVAGLRRGRRIPEPKGPASESREKPSVGLDRPVEASRGLPVPLRLEEIRDLLRSPSRAEQGLGLKALGSLEFRGEKLALLGELLEGGDAGMKSRALTLLKTLGGTDPVALAAAVLQKDGPSWLRSQAARVLGDLGDPTALLPLLEATGTNDLQVRAAAAASLDQLGLPAAQLDLIATLAEMLDHPDGRVREDAIDTLSTFTTPAVLSALAKALGDRSNSRIRESAAEALGQMRLTEAILPLEGALNDSDPGVRKAAQLALDAIRSAGK